MGSHFALLVDRLLSESNLEAAIESRTRFQQVVPLSFKEAMVISHKMDVKNMSFPTILAQCRICHDEDEESNMETPCSCCGSLKYAHRECVQRWCNEKGDTICEICQQQFKPDYTAPPPLFHCGGIPLSFRGHWGSSGGDMHNLRFVAMVHFDDPELSDTDFDEYPAHSGRSLICCRVIAIIFLLLLVLRHSVPVLISDAGVSSLTLFMLMMLRTVGILLLICFMVKAFTAFQQRRQQSQISFSPTSSDDEDNGLTPPQSRVIHIR